MAKKEDFNDDLFLDEDEEVIVLKNEETGEEVIYLGCNAGGRRFRQSIRLP